MSGDEDKSFLARWSQRKQEAKQPEPRQDEPVAEAGPPPQLVAESESEPEFDLSSLPKLEEMTGTTDITGFLRKGVPEQLRNAALRQSWALDPAIRNYVNPALEYAYDWNTPGGVPGSSEIGAGMDVARLVSHIMGTGESPAEASEPAVDPAMERDKPAPSSEPEAAQTPAPDLPAQSIRLGDEGISVAQKPGTEAAQAAEPDADAAPQHPVRRHGSAKPLV
jgi:hypothetical protein